MYILYKYLCRLLATVLDFLRQPYVQAKWRARNRHNFTTAGNRREDYRFPIDKVRVGRYTYGALRVFSYNSNEEGLTIGSFCSIAEDVTFMLGGGHDYRKAFSFPFAAIFDKREEAISKGGIVVEDDVWIGANTLILSGVRISRGTVIAAGSVVTKDTEPYSIVGGVPAKHIKYRFSDDVIKKMMSLDFSRIDKDFYQRNRSLFNGSPELFAEQYQQCD